MKKFGFLDQADKYLKDAGMETIVIDGVEPNPSVKTVKRGAAEMAAFQPDWIVAIGGGSALDAAKVMWCFYEHPELSFEDIIQPGSMPGLRNKAKFAAIPSTSGTASEITAFSVMQEVCLPMLQMFLLWSKFILSLIASPSLQMLEFVSVKSQF